MSLPSALAEIVVKRDGRVLVTVRVVVNRKEKITKILTDVPYSAINWAKKNADIAVERKEQQEYLLKDSKAWEFMARAGLLR
ncbi:hypothetical protein [Thermococcus sp. LS2]|uniref:hypothetical protein n=1 Tax=Thermococcus sp. LS2 TaxID=1638260 RepID=UPI00143CBCC0|nr:hypothetical protein [Thermococcus sp. LS2]NJE13758.1 hypothetical protein [Thermococcus sp. LS2]